MKEQRVSAYVRASSMHFFDFSKKACLGHNRSLQLKIIHSITTTMTGFSSLGHSDFIIFKNQALFETANWRQNLLKAYSCSFREISFKGYLFLC